MNINGEYFCHLATAEAAGGVGIHSPLDFINLKTSLLAVVGPVVRHLGCVLSVWWNKHVHLCLFVFLKKKEAIMRTLKEVNIGETVKVVKITGEGPVKRRIMDMGITKGTEIYIRKVAPLGDPIEVTIRGYELSLRKADIDIIQVEDK